jgi:hypothetical protein
VSDFLQDFSQEWRLAADLIASGRRVAVTAAVVSELEIDQ